MPERLRCYNQYPGLYNNFDSMREDLPRIRKLGFKQVWVNPFFTPCQTNPIPKMEHKIHSPYAMQSDVIYPRYAQNESMVKAYTKEAKKLGLTPMFDLVPRHVAVDNRLVSGDPDLLKRYNIDTKKWFKRYDNGNLKIYSMDENYNPTGENPWSDVAIFDYDTPEIREQILKYFWEPLLKYLIETLGFSGIRVDAPGMIPTDALRSIMDIARKYNIKCNGAEPLVLAETIGGFHEENLALKGIVTHTMNSGYWMPGPEGGFGHDYALWRDDDNWFAKTKGQLQTVGPTVGYAGSHDEERYAQQLFDKGIKDVSTIEKRMKEKFAAAALASDGGWILQYGDDFGATKRINIFDLTPIEYHKDKQLQAADYSSFIRDLNQTVAQLPKPVFPEWTQRVFSSAYPDLVIFIIHQGPGFSANSFLVVANLDEKNPVALSYEDFHEILNANGRNDSREKTKLPEKLYLCGAVYANAQLTRLFGSENICSSQNKLVNNASLFGRASSKDGIGAQASPLNEFMHKCVNEIGAAFKR